MVGSRFREISFRFGDAKIVQKILPTQFSIESPFPELSDVNEGKNLLKSDIYSSQILINLDFFRLWPVLLDLDFKLLLTNWVLQNNGDDMKYVYEYYYLKSITIVLFQQYIQ